MNIVLLEYTHRHGTDVRPYILPDGMTSADLPVIDNDLMCKLDYCDPELEREDESAEWIGPFDTKTMEQIASGDVSAFLSPPHLMKVVPENRSEGEGFFVKREGVPIVGTKEEIQALIETASWPGSTVEAVPAPLAKDQRP